MNKEEIERELLELTRYLTANMIPFNPPLTEQQMSRMKIHNRRGFDKLMRYLELENNLKEN